MLATVPSKKSSHERSVCTPRHGLCHSLLCQPCATPRPEKTSQHVWHLSLLHAPGINSLPSLLLACDAPN